MSTNDVNAAESIKDQFSEPQHTAALTIDDDAEGMIITEVPEPHAVPVAVAAGAKAAGKGAAFGAGGAVGHEVVTSASDAALGVDTQTETPDVAAPEHSSVDTLVEIHEEASN